MTMKKMSDYEKSVKKLEEIVQKLEEGQLPLEESIKLYEEGTKLSRECYATLKNAEQKIRELSQIEQGGEENK